ncbi:hypothetical protein Tco_0184736 [Tanacetum coccineum]
MRPGKRRNSGDMKIHTLKRFRYTVFSTCDHGMSVNGLSRYIRLLRKMLWLGWSDIIGVGGRGLDRRRGIGRHMCVGVYRSGRPYSNGCKGVSEVVVGCSWATVGMVKQMAAAAQNINNMTIRELVYLEQPMTPLPYLVASQAAHDAYEALYDAQNEVACLMLGSMSPELQRTLENNKAYDMIQELKTMFKEQAKQELFEIVKAFHACKQDDGQSVSSYLLKMKSYLDTLERLGYAMPNELGETLAELHAMLKLHEKGIPKKAETLAVLAIREGKIQKDNKKLQWAKGKAKGKNKLTYAPNTKIPPPPKRDNPTKDSICHHYKEVGLRGSRKLKHGALSLYMGNGMRACVEAIKSFDLILPSGLIIVLDNCHFAPTVTRGVVSISHLVNNANYRPNQLNKKTFKEIQALYIKEQERDANFVPIGSERDEKMIDKMNKKAAGMDEEEVPEEPDNTKVKVKQEENDELRLYLTIISDEDKEVDYEILDKKYPIIEWKYEYHGIKPQFDETKDLEEININVVIRSNGQRRYFSTLIRVLSIFDREDLCTVYKLVMNIYQDETPEGVHTLMTDARLVIHMLVEKKYPLRKKVLLQMLELKLESEEDNTMALELIRFVKKLIAELEPENFDGDRKDLLASIY